MIQKFIPKEIIEQRIYLVREQRVMLDRDLARLYGVTTGNLNKAVNRNLDRFPDDFMFLLSNKEVKNLIFQNGISSWGGIRKLTRVFTEHGILMLSSVLKSKKAVQANIQIMRIFIKLRKFLSSHKELAYKLKQLEGKIEKHDEDIRVIFQAIHELMEPVVEEKPKRMIGFNAR